MRAVQNKWLELTWHIPGPLYKEKCQIYLQLWNVYAVYCNVFLPIRQTAKIPSRSEEFIVLLIPSNPFYSYTRAHTEPLTVAMTNYTKVWIRWLTVSRWGGHQGVRSNCIIDRRLVTPYQHRFDSIYMMDLTISRFIRLNLWIRF